MGCFGVGDHSVRRAVGRDNGYFVGNAKLFADGDRAHHGWQVGVAAHNDADLDRSGRLWSGHVFSDECSVSLQWAGGLLFLNDG